MIDEAQLIQNCQDGYEQSYIALVHRYYKPVFRQVYSMLGDYGEAEDLTQEIFIIVFKDISKYRGDAAFSNWLFKIAIYQSRARQRYLYNRGIGEYQSDDVEIPTNMNLCPEALCENSELRDLLINAIELLEPDLKRVIQMQLFQNYSLSQISTEVGVSKTTLKTRLALAKSLLREFLSDWIEMQDFLPERADNGKITDS
jgi:RNA polymerase sigma-70 factor (ECF subfamily)